MAIIRNVADAFGNGKDTTRPPKNTVLLDTNGTIVVGQEQDVPTYVYDAAESLSGAVTDINVWSRRLREDEMAAISGCLTRGKGDILDWDTSDFEIGLDSSISEMELIDTCDIVPRSYFMFPSQLQFTKGVRLCRAFGGEMAAPKNLEEQVVVHSLAEKSKELCSHDGDPLTWLGLQRNNTDDTWHYLNSKEDVTFFNWAEGQPDKEEEENCIVLKGYPFQGAWADQSCRETYKVCVLCALEMPVLLRSFLPLTHLHPESTGDVRVIHLIDLATFPPVLKCAPCRCVFDPSRECSPAPAVMVDSYTSP
ncbi:hypothetical protein O3P69_009396 [Scylla paramamosain]|uniref:C-type lectin domain-containing protein n=1 Tax=Scylla paramamosain TaxID=85552 RepID=A0AAW0SX20_SCYPA